MSIKAPLRPAPGERPDVLIAVVTYNSAGLIERFLRALPAALTGAGTATVVVVDNDSADGTPDLVRTLAPWVDVVEPGANRGYGAGINVALRHTRARRGVYVLNPDAVPSPGSVARLAQAVEDHPDVGIAVPRIVDRAGRLKFSLRREPTIRRALGEAVLGGHRAARFTAWGDMIRDAEYYADGARADWATGAAMFLAPRTLDAVGQWEEDYFLYSEETDYALRARDVGLHVRLVGDADVVHPGGDMSVSPWLWSLVAVNRTRLYRRRHGAVAGSVYWLIVLLNEGSRSLLGRPTHRAAVRALIRGARDVPRSPQPAAPLAAARRS
ncbi:glycosyltransferase family 2 protein [Georgenia sp. H159]|uniref:glycosyltransferase family 2 protein n=1 Tax=Georgenia sp. H159 TaxID=3076115 RepID=UPI002D782020|nr:glycosyltransferase family 2 protein [Georgenia sp. H159]